MISSTSPKDGMPVAREKTTAIKKASNTTTLSRFKEKRPEPLKLNPNINQDTPLDLSVKSAGNVPSGTLSSIFNSHLATLETPRIQWQDTDALLAAGKNRSISSSTNASQKAPISALVGESPPVTPSSPLIDMILTSSRNQSKSGDTTLAIDPSLPADQAFESKKAQILDRWSQTSKLLSSSGPRRSCSIDNLNLHNSSDQHQQQAGSDKLARLRVRQDESGAHTPKKNSISPLATNSLSNTTQNEINSSTKFSYSNQQISTNSTDTQKPLTPTNVANATANLLNIHLNSPPAGSQAQGPMASSFGPNYKTTGFSSFDHEPSPLDPLISAAFCQQQQQQHQINHLQQQQQQQSNGRSSINFSTSSLSNDLNNNILMPHHNISSISSSATLNTPTLISPSQLKAGQLCFLPSPTLSPMSSVFDLPSPFLMFPPSSTKQATNTTSHSHNKTTDISDQEPLTTNAIRTNSDNLLNKIPRSTNSINGAASASDLSHLITSATSKMTAQTIVKQEDIDTNDNEEEIDMDIELDIGKPPKPTNENQREMFARPATVIPQICVSDDQAEGLSRSHGQPREGRVQRDPSSKRSLSPKSFRVQVKNYRTERLESSSAPPEIEQRRVRPKIKTIGADSCSNLAVHKNELGVYEMNNKDTSRSQLTINQNCRAVKPYPEVVGARSSSAEPTIYSRAVGNKVSSTSAINSTENVALGCYQSDRQLSQQEGANCLSQSAQQLNASLYQPIISKQQQLQQHQIHGSFQQNHQSLHQNNHNYHYYSQQQQQQQHQNNGTFQQNHQSLHQNNRNYHYYSQQQQQQQQQQQHSVSAGELNKIHSQSNQRQPMMMMNYAYQIDIETRSDSRSSSSLDFPGPYVGNGSGPNSAASSNLASKKYHCDMCSKSFTRSDMLTRHRRLHSGDRPFQCGECKQEFSRSDHLSTHMRTHTGEKPYKCKLCSYSACRKDMITRHLKVHSRSPNASDFV